MTTKEFAKERYVAQKAKIGRKPTADEYYEFSDIPEGRLVTLFGPSPYTKLQAECGDVPNKLEMARTPLDDIMRQYGDLALELQHLPTEPEWRHKGCRPARAGLRKPPHNLLWSQMPARFRQWAEAGRTDQYERVLALIPKTSVVPSSKTAPTELVNLLKAIRQWSPARRRNTEGEYKIELRKHLESRNYKLNEEYGESTTDLVVNRQFAIETKKEPQQSDYDRLFGQIARHLQHHPVVIAVIFDVPNEDKLDNFKELIDTHLNVDKFTVEVVKK
jgi:hypothetical protein